MRNLEKHDTGDGSALSKVDKLIRSEKIPRDGLDFYTKNSVEHKTA